MADSKDEERDEEWFKEVYGKEYTGPVRPANDTHDNSGSRKRQSSQGSGGELDEDNHFSDPSAVPTDFTSREAKVWEAKVKAIERNWKKKKEDELTCRICGEYGHFPQGCPTTLGPNRTKTEIIERVQVKDKRLKPRIIGSGGVTIQGIEKDTGCRLQLEDNHGPASGSFSVRITGSNRMMVRRAVEVVKNLIDQVQGERKSHDGRRPHGPPNHTSPIMTAQMQHFANQRMQPDTNIPPHPGQGSYGFDQHGMDQVSQQWESENFGGTYSRHSYGHKGGHQFDDSRAFPKGSGSTNPDVDSGGYGHQQSIAAQTVEELEYTFVQETTQLFKEVNDAEDKENARHREAIREIQEQYKQRSAALRSQQAQRWEEFLRHGAQFRQHAHFQQAPPGSNFYGYDSAGPVQGFNRGVDDQQHGYGMASGDRKEGLGEYGSRRVDEAHHDSNNSGHPFGQGGYDNQPYDANPYGY